MPIQAPQWTEFLSCPICYNVFGERHNRPISLGCGHTICRVCLGKIEQKKCPFDQTIISREIDELPVNFALLQLVGVAIPEAAEAADEAADSLSENLRFYLSAKSCIEDLAIHLKPALQAGGQAGGVPPLLLSRPMQRKLVTLVNCQLLEEEGRDRLIRAARSLGERTVTELILQHQNPQQLSANLWAAVRARGCQFLGPAMQEEVLNLVLLALEDGSALSRKVLVLFAVQRLEPQYTQASKTAVGHVIQLLYRASCFKVTKREEESSLMQLKDEFRTYDALRREHDSQIVQIATEAGLRISPEQWSSLLYGDAARKSYMQSIIDKLQTPASFFLSVSELMLALQRTNDPGNLSRMKPHFDLLSNIDPSPDSQPPSWENLEAVMRSVLVVVEGLIDFVHARNSGKADPIAHHNTKFKTSMCRDLIQKGKCPRGTTCTFAHSQEEMERFRNQNKKFGVKKTKAMLACSDATALPSDDVLDFMPYSSMTSQVDTTNEPTPPKLQISRSTVMVSATQQNVAVPVVCPSIMPVQAKKAISQQTIYTSPTHTRDLPFSPRPVPMSQCAPPPHIIFKADGPPITTSAEQKSPTKTVRKPASTVHIHPKAKEPVLCLPVSTYPVHTRSNIPADSHYYLSERVRGLSVTEEMAVLHRRKTQLIAQLIESQSTATLPIVSTLENLPSYSGYIHKSTSRAADTLANTRVSCMATSRTSYQDTVALANDHFNVDPPRSYVNFEQAEEPSMTTSNVCTSVSSEPLDPGLSAGQGPPTSMVTSREQDSYSFSSPEHNIHHDYQQKQGVPEYSFQGMKFSNYKLWMLGEDDEFIPFEHNIVSKFGPISRTARVKTKNSQPVQVQAPQGKETTPVTAVTSFLRPNPNSYQVPSRFDGQKAPGQMAYEMSGVVFEPNYQAQADPKGLYVATSLPTALMQPTVITAGSTIKSNTLYRLKKKVLNLANTDMSTTLTNEEQMRTELVQLNDKIENLLMSEEERLARELQAVELSIQESQRKLNNDREYCAYVSSTKVPQSSSDTIAKERHEFQLKRDQEDLDRKLAEKLVLEEARHMYYK